MVKYKNGIEIDSFGTIFRDVFERKRMIKVDGDMVVYKCLSNVRSFIDIRKHIFSPFSR